MSRVKQSTFRDAALLSMAKDKPCLLQVPGVCCGDPQTTVACHSNRLGDGKGRAIKANDFMSVWGCRTCHAWLDQSKANKQEKSDVFDIAHAEQLQQWSEIYHLRTGKESDTALRAILHYTEWSKV